MAFQATLVGVLAVLLGVPLGLLAGSWGWEAVTTHLGLSPARPTVFVSCIVAAAVTILAANVVAFGPGWRAGRLRPATLLRTE